MRDPDVPRSGRDARGLFVPDTPSGSGNVRPVDIGGIGGSLTILSYNYWMREEQIRGAGYLRYVRGDIAIAYLFTAVFGISIALIANQAFFMPAIRISDAQAVPRMAEMLGGILGRFGALPIRSDSGRRSSPRCWASGRACRTCTQTSTASSGRCRPRRRGQFVKVTIRPIVWHSSSFPSSRCHSPS